MGRERLIGFAVVVSLLGAAGCGGSSTSPTGASGVVAISDLRVTPASPHGLALELLNGASATSQSGTLQCQIGYNPAFSGAAVSGTFSVTDQGRNLSNALSFSAVAVAAARRAHRARRLTPNAARRSCDESLRRSRGSHRGLCGRPVRGGFRLCPDQLCRDLGPGPEPKSTRSARVGGAPGGYGSASAQLPAVSLVVEQNGDVVKATRSVQVGNTERSVTTTYTANGSPQTFTGWRNATVVTKAVWDGARLVVSSDSTRPDPAGGETQSSRESVWSLSPDGQTLTIQTTFQGPRGERRVNLVYQRG